MITRSTSLLYRLRWALACAMGILLLCLLPGNDLPAWEGIHVPHLDKLVHATMFFTLAALLAQAFLDHGTPRALLLAFVLATAYGVCMELLQDALGQGRSMEWGDMLANATGAGLMVPYARWCTRRGRSLLPFRFLR